MSNPTQLVSSPTQLSYDLKAQFYTPQASLLPSVNVIPQIDPEKNENLNLDFSKKNNHIKKMKYFIINID